MRRSLGRGLAGALGASALALAACQTAAPKPDQGNAAAPGGPTPDVPYEAKNGARPSGPSSGGQQVSVDPGTRQTFQAGVAATERGDNERAEQAFRQVLQRNDKLDYAWTNLGVVYEREGRLREAEDAYQRAISLRPDEDAAWDDLARLYCRSGRAAQVENLLRGRISQAPAALGPRNALVYTLMQEGKGPVAAVEAKKVLKADERNVRAMQLLALEYFREQKLELAKMVLENARAIDGNDAVTHNTLGLVNLALKNKPAALECFQKAATLKPDFAEATNNYGALLNESQDYDGAIKELSLAVAAAPDFPDARLNLGNAYRGKQDFPRALAEYQQVIKLRPQWADTYFNLAILHLDSELPNQDTVQRLKASLAYFQEYKDHGGRDERVEQYEKDANKGIDREMRRRDRERRDQLKKASAPAGAPSTGSGANSTGNRTSAVSTKQPASRLGDDETPPARSTTKPPASGKLSGDDK